MKNMLKSTICMAERLQTEENGEGSGNNATV